MQPTAMHISLEIARFIAQAAITGLWQGLVLIVAVGIFLHFMSRLGAAVRFALWGLAFTLAATLPLMHLPAGTLIQAACDLCGGASGSRVGIRHRRVLDHPYACARHSPPDARDLSAARLETREACFL